MLALAARVSEVVVVGRLADDGEDELRDGARRARGTARGKGCGEDEGGDEGDAEDCRPAGVHTHGFALWRPDPTRLPGGPPVPLG